MLYLLYTISNKQISQSFLQFVEGKITLLSSTTLICSKILLTIKLKPKLLLNIYIYNTTINNLSTRIILINQYFRLFFNSFTPPNSNLCNRQGCWRNTNCHFYYYATTLQSNVQPSPGPGHCNTCMHWTGRRSRSSRPESSSRMSRIHSSAPSTARWTDHSSTDGENRENGVMKMTSIVAITIMGVNIYGIDCGDDANSNTYENVPA